MKLIPWLSVVVIVSASVSGLFYYKESLSNDQQMQAGPEPSAKVQAFRAQNTYYQKQLSVIGEGHAVKYIALKNELAGKVSKVNISSGDIVGKNEVKYLTNLAQAYGHLKQASKAVESLNRAQVLAPNSGEVAYASAIVYSLLNEKASAIHHVKAALINNTGSVLFNLPWFDALCNEQLFQQLMTDYDNASRCSV